MYVTHFTYIRLFSTIFLECCRCVVQRHQQPRASCRSTSWADERARSWRRTLSRIHHLQSHSSWCCLPYAGRSLFNSWFYSLVTSFVSPVMIFTSEQRLIWHHGDTRIVNTIPRTGHMGASLRSSCSAHCQNNTPLGVLMLTSLS